MQIKESKTINSDQSCAKEIPCITTTEPRRIGWRWLLLEGKQLLQKPLLQTWLGALLAGGVQLSPDPGL